MDPDGSFDGNTITVKWNPVELAVKYFVRIEQCQTEPCQPVYDEVITNTNTTRLEMTDQDKFGPCTFYSLQVIAEDSNSYRLSKETKFIIKDDNECNQHLHIIIGVTLSILVLLALLLLFAILFYLRKSPMEKIQRARSRIYSRLYSRDKYVRPYDKSTFVQELENNLMHDLAFDLEFSELEQLADDTIQRRMSFSTLPVNRRRNRYQDVVPFDATRVVLEKPLSIESNGELSNYINASLISDLSGQVHSPFYIAAQGPSQETMNLFWEMIWQQNVRVIVMLTNLIEGIGFHSSKCSQYWPDLVGNTRRFHDISVQLYDCQDAPDYLVRKFDVSRNEITRSIVHVQCTSWPDRCAPKNASVLLQLIDVVRALASQYGKNDRDNPKTGPWLIHCSAGVGRTGTFIALDQIMRMYDEPIHSEIDVFNVVYQLRKERRYLVQTLSQYTYLYKCLYEHSQKNNSS